MSGYGETAAYGSLPYKGEYYLIIFNQSGNIVTIDGVVVYGSDFWDKKKNQFSERNLSGTDITYSIDDTVCEGILIIKDVSYLFAQSLKFWLRDKAVFKENTFTIATNHADINLGSGKGVTITGVNFIKEDDKGVFNYEKPGIYTVKFPYRFIR